jgi:hypothetical protein
MRLLSILLLFAALPALAQETCKTSPDPALRLACYEESPIPAQCAAHKDDLLLKVGCLDLANGRPLAPRTADEARQCQLLLPDKDAALRCYQLALPAPVALVTPPEEFKYWTVQIREQSLSKFYKLNEAAVIGYKHENHRSDPLIKAAAVADGPPVGVIKNWNWFASLDLNIDLSGPGKQRANSKALGAGVRGIMFDYLDDGFAIDSTIRLSAKKDSELHTSSTGFVIGNLLAKSGWVDGAMGQSEGLPFQFVPAFGLSYEKLHEVDAGKPKGAYTSAYGGVNIAVWPPMLKRTQLSLKYQRFTDLSATGGLEKRYHNYSSIGLEYFLYDPAKEAPKFTPRVALLREIGDDPLTATADKNRTLLVFKFTLN